jgi:hypothetical protein
MPTAYGTSKTARPAHTCYAGEIYASPRWCTRGIKCCLACLHVLHVVHQIYRHAAPLAGLRLQHRPFDPHTNSDDDRLRPRDATTAPDLLAEAMRVRTYTTPMTPPAAREQKLLRHGHTDAAVLDARKNGRWAYI